MVPRSDLTHHTKRTMDYVICRPGLPFQEGRFPNLRPTERLTRETFLKMGDFGILASVNAAQPGADGTIVFTFHFSNRASIRMKCLTPEHGLPPWLGNCPGWAALKLIEAEETPRPMTKEEAGKALEEFTGSPRCSDCGWKTGTDITDNCPCHVAQNGPNKDSVDPEKYKAAFQKARKLQKIYHGL